MDFQKLNEVSTKHKSGRYLRRRQQEGLRRVARKNEFLFLSKLSQAKAGFRPGRHVQRFVWMGTNRLQHNVATVHE